MSDADDLRSLAGERLAQYVELFEGAGAKLSAGTYRSDDLVADWYRWFGMAARDTTAALTLAMRAAQAERRRPDATHAADDPPGAGDGPEGTGG